ncbi:MAG: class I SAM-dependent methyltransferase [Alphaproteobacteria bacterium]|nr:class I SAM-dependent methyltransferase [Alphaproteobacteria bacterium]
MLTTQSKKIHTDSSYKRNGLEASPVVLTSSDIFKYDDLNLKIWEKSPEAQLLLNFKDISNQYLLPDAIELENMNASGFNCETLDSFSTRLQHNSKFRSARNCGWHKIFEIILDLAHKNYFSLYDLTILDFVDCNGTLGKKVSALWQYCIPNVIGIDMCQKICNSTYTQDKIVSWKKHSLSDFEDESAECAVATFSLLNLPKEQLSAFISGIQKVLKTNGFCILHDCIEGFPAERWYPDVIMEYRPSTHTYNFITHEAKLKILKRQFNKFDHMKIYDPFYLLGKKGQTQKSLKREFYSNLISQYNLSKLLPKKVNIENIMEYEDENYWQKIDEEFSPYFNLGNEFKTLEGKNINNSLIYSYLKDPQVPLVDKLSFKKISVDQYALIAPRVALVGIGC